MRSTCVLYVTPKLKPPVHAVKITAKANAELRKIKRTFTYMGYDAFLSLCKNLQ